MEVANEELSHQAEDCETPAWSPSGRWIVSAANSGTGARAHAPGRYRRAPATSSYPLTKTSPTWSPGGSIVFSRGGIRSWTGVFSVRADGDRPPPARPTRRPRRLARRSADDSPGCPTAPTGLFVMRDSVAAQQVTADGVTELDPRIGPAGSSAVAAPARGCFGHTGPSRGPEPALSPQRERSTQRGDGDGLSLLGGGENAVHGVEAVHHALEADKLRRNARRRAEPRTARLRRVADRAQR